MSTPESAQLRVPSLAPVAPRTELTIVGGEVFRVEGDAKDVERVIMDASRGSLMALAWLTDAGTGESLGFNPEHVVLLRKLDSQ
jgi:hypothetical protein